MKKILSMLLVCIFVLSMILSLSSCKWWRNRHKDDPTQDPTDDPTVETPEGDPDDGSGMSNGKIKLPAIKIPGLVPEE